MPHDSRAVAKHFLGLAKSKGKELTPMQLIKLVYIAHGWMLGLYENQLIRDDIEAWQYGPVIRKLYNSIRKYGARPVSELNYDGDSADLNKFEADVVRQVFEHYADYTGVQLSKMTHQAGTPWAKTWDSYGKNVVIPQDNIEEHFRSLADGS